jgi:TRAP-type uncharacterized transport system fused permease subunit
MKNKKEFLESFHSVIIGFFLTVEGFDKFTNHRFIGGLILVFGILILLYFLYNILTKRESALLKLIVHLSEGIALSFTSYIFFKEGKIYLPYITLLASVGFFISVVILLIKAEKKGGK